MLTQVQQQALDALMTQAQASGQSTTTSSPGISHVPPIMPEGIEALLRLLSGAPEAWQVRLQTVLDQKTALQSAFLDWSERNPMDAAFVTLGAAALAFYQAERGVNPKVNSYMDAYYYISTCASVGYADIFAVTQTGKAIAALVMTVGPALAAKALARPV